MAFASVGTLGVAASLAPATSIVLTTGATAEAGNIVIVTVAKDNASSSDGNTNEITSVTDSAGGNTWTKAREFCNSQGAADAGATVAVYYSRLANQIASGGTITANFSNSPVAFCISAWEFTGTAISVDGTPIDLANDGADPGSMALSGLTSAEHIFFRGIAIETGALTGLTATTNFTKIGETSDTEGQMAVEGEFRILTATGATSDPSGETADQASVFIGFIEVAAGGTSVPSRMMMGVGT